MMIALDLGARMNKGQAISEMNESCGNYEPKNGSAGTQLIDDKWQDVCGLIATLPEEGQKELAWYSLTACDMAGGKCAIHVLRSVGVDSPDQKEFSVAWSELKSAVDGDRNGSAEASILSYEISKKLAQWDSDFLFRLSDL